MQKFTFKIKQSFNLASKTYDNASYIQQASAKQLVNSLVYTFPNFKPKMILDIGTGTGNLITYLIKHYYNSEYTLNDISENMLQIATQKFMNTIKIRNIVGNFETILFDYHDLCISNFALQWTNNLFSVIEKFYNNNRIFAFTCLLYNTFSEYKNFFIKNTVAAPKIPDYPTKEDLYNFLISLNPVKYLFYSKIYSINFTNIKEFLKYLKNLGARINFANLDIPILKKIASETGAFHTTYHVYFVILKKK